MRHTPTFPARAGKAANSGCPIAAYLSVAKVRPTIVDPDVA